MTAEQEIKYEGISFLSSENCIFKEENNFLILSRDNADIRVKLHRAFPFDSPDEYISVKDMDDNEIGIIKHISELDEQSRSAVKNELDLKYYTPSIKKIKSLKERYGFSYWQTECEDGNESFTVKDTYRSIMKLEGGRRLIITDIDGCRREVRDTALLDRASLKKLEIYL